MYVRTNQHGLHFNIVVVRPINKEILSHDVKKLCKKSTLKMTVLMIFMLCITDFAACIPFRINVNIHHVIQLYQCLHKKTSRGYKST